MVCPQPLVPFVRLYTLAVRNAFHRSYTFARSNKHLHRWYSYTNGVLQCLISLYEHLHTYGDNNNVWYCYFDVFLLMVPTTHSNSVVIQTDMYTQADPPPPPLPSIAGPLPPYPPPGHRLCPPLTPAG